MIPFLFSLYNIVVCFSSYHAEYEPNIIWNKTYRQTRRYYCRDSNKKEDQNVRK